MISESEKNYLKTSVLIPDILLDLGYRTDHRGYMYFSPFREESSHHSLTMPKGIFGLITVQGLVEIILNFLSG